MNAGSPALRPSVVTYMAEYYMPHCRGLTAGMDAPDVERTQLAGLPLVVRTLKREVRVFGGCLGMHRR